MRSAIQVADYILQLGQKSGCKISPSRMLMILYFSQMAALQNRAILFDEDFFMKGVVPIIKPIDKALQKGSLGELLEKEPPLSEEDRKVVSLYVDSVFDVCKDLHINKLTLLVIRSSAFKETTNGEMITKESMKESFFVQPQRIFYRIDPNMFN